MSRSEHRGGSWVASGHGADVIAAAQDRRLPVSEAPNGPELDAHTMAGALALKRKIIAHWAAQGREVECRIEIGVFGWPVVRSNLLGGRPR